MFQAMLDNLESLSGKKWLPLKNVTFFRLYPEPVYKIPSVFSGASEVQYMDLLVKNAEAETQKKAKYLQDFAAYSPTKYLYVQTHVDGHEDCIIDIFYEIHSGSNYSSSMRIANSEHPVIVDYLESFGRENFQKDMAILTLGHLLRTLNEKDSVMGTSRPTLKNRSGAEIIVPIVYVSDKKSANKFQALESTPIEWTHSWEVIGHWRTVKGLGKDKVGNRTVDGKTWVKACVKGQGELIKKVRVVG